MEDVASFPSLLAGRYEKILLRRLKRTPEIILPIFKKRRRHAKKAKRRRK